MDIIGYVGYCQAIHRPFGGLIYGRLSENVRRSVRRDRRGDPVLECVPQALPCARVLCTALEQAETLYIEADEAPLCLLPQEDALGNGTQA